MGFQQLPMQTMDGHPRIVAPQVVVMDDKLDNIAIL
jgi:hypothetical protein